MLSQEPTHISLENSSKINLFASVKNVDNFLKPFHKIPVIKIDVMKLAMIGTSAR